jgi:signal transduction histidine kinase
VLAMLDPKFRQHAVRGGLHVDGPIPEANLPVNSLRQVLYNLLSNAIEASPEQSSVRVTLGTVPDGLQILVSDEGPGVPEGLEAKIFEPFFTAKPSGDGDRANLGLGLAVCREIVARLGGSLDFQNQPGKGCVFRLVVPINATVDKH